MSLDGLTAEELEVLGVEPALSAEDLYALGLGPNPAPAAANTESWMMLQTEAERLKSRAWRLNNLYWIKDKEGQRVIFKPRPNQQEAYDKLGRRSIVLKIRQPGMTTAFCILWLDKALFSNEIDIGIIAHKREVAATILRDKIKYAYDNLPEDLKRTVRMTRDTEHEIVFSNGSKIRVDTSFRSGTPQILHITEYGEICAKFPQRQDEIRTGAMEAVPKDGIILIESTAKGHMGHFKELVDEAHKIARRKAPHDWGLYFLPWFQVAEYTIDEPDFAFTEFEEQYLNDLAKNVTLTRGQRVWWARKQRGLGGGMFSEYPSTVAEAFRQSNEGAYYGQEMLDAWHEMRIHSIPPNPGLARVHTSWDLGFRDSTTIVFWQQIGHRYLVVDYYENNGVPFEHYARVVEEKRQKYRWVYGRHIGPHDLEQHSGQTGLTTLEWARRFGIHFEVAPSLTVQDGINAVRVALKSCEFDETRCDLLIKHLELYRKGWDARLGKWKDQPLHDDHSHAADAFRYGVISLAKESPMGYATVAQARPVKVRRFV